MNYSIKAYLFTAGLIMMFVGSYIALAPSAYLASLATHTANLHPPFEYSVNTLSDTRGMGGMLLIFSVYIVLSVFRSAWQTSALIIATMVYTSFVVFRTLGYILDGFPSTQLLIAYAIEFVLFASGLWLIRKNRFAIA